MKWRGRQQELAVGLVSLAANIRTWYLQRNTVHAPYSHLDASASLPLLAQSRGTCRAQPLARPAAESSRERLTALLAREVPQRRYHLPTNRKTRSSMSIAARTCSGCLVHLSAVLSCLTSRCLRAWKPAENQPDPQWVEIT